MAIEMNQNENDTLEMIESVVSFITQFESCAVAMSAGVDSAVVAKAAFLALGDSAIAVTAESPSLASQLVFALALSLSLPFLPTSPIALHIPCYIAVVKQGLRHA